MALAAGSAVARPIESILEIIPVAGMGIVSAGPASCTVAIETDITVGVTRLAGDQRFARLAGMADRPGVEVRGHRALQVTGITLR